MTLYYFERLISILPTFCLISISFLALYLLFRILSKSLLKLFSPKQNHHVLTPGKYSPTQNAGDWLDTFEFFLDEGKVTSNAEKCAAFLSRMEGGVRKTLLNYNRNVRFMEQSKERVKNTFLNS